MRKNIQQKQHGFSLIETLIAVSILMIAISGPLALVQAGLFSSIHQRNQVTATYLAQEALEYVKNIRDTNTYLAVPWLTGLEYCKVGEFPAGCYVDPHGTLPENQYVQAVVGVSLPLHQHNDNSDPANPVFLYYAYVNGDGVSPYTRTVKITPFESNPDEVNVSVTIDWKDNAISRSYTVSENIYNYEQ